MRRLWLIFAQAVTISVAGLFVLSTLKPEWLRDTAPASVVAILEAPTADGERPAAAASMHVEAATLFGAAADIAAAGVDVAAGRSTLVGNVASLESLERFGRWTPVIGFPFFTYGILTGLCGVWHRPDLKVGAWFLDPVLVSSLLVWAVFGYLCYGSLYKPQIRGKRAAVLSTYGLGLIVVAYLFRVFFSLLHI